jgi:hypothetical protein
MTRPASEPDVTGTTTVSAPAAEFDDDLQSAVVAPLPPGENIGVNNEVDRVWLHVARGLDTENIPERADRSIGRRAATVEGWPQAGHP